MKPLSPHQIDATGLASGQYVLDVVDGRIVGLVEGAGGSSGGGGGDTAWGVPTLQNNWINYGATQYSTAAYRKDGSGFVHLRGLVKSGTFGQPIFTLPAGYRPDKEQGFAVVANQGMGQINIYPDGRVIQVVGSTAATSLNGVSFFAEA